MTVAPGQSFNSGFGLFAASGLPCVTPNTTMAFNECTFGFSPHAGATYYCSRMPGDFGTFLLLTGARLDGNDLLNLKIADNYVDIPKNYHEEI